jgi:thiol:disulfide interchange protein
MAIRTNEELDPNEGPGLGCFTVQAILFAAILLLIPVGVFSLGWPVWLLTALLVLAIILLFFISMTSVFLLRVFFASRRTGSGRTYGATAAPVTIDTDPPGQPDGPAQPEEPESVSPPSTESEE